MNYVYILRCADGTYYTGWTNDITARLAAHNSGTSGAKYTRTRRPVKLVYCEAFAERGHAMQREAEIKRFSRAEKQQLVDRLDSGEKLTIYDAREMEAGTMPRALVHAMGLRHHVCHLWLIEERAGVLGHWLQQRAIDRPLYPNMYDLAATGHIAEGETPIEGVIREAWEEIGINFTQAQLVFIDTAEQKYARADGGFDNELSYAFAARVNSALFQIGSEVQRMVWVPFSEFQKAEIGAAVIIAGEEPILTSELCCLHKAEWKRFVKHLSGNENK